MSRRLVVLGLSLSSAWGNGHAVTYRALLSALAARGWEILFLEREAAWYANSRDLKAPSFCELAFYDSVEALANWRGRIAAADVTLVGSFVPEGARVGALAQRWAQGLTAFYDIDTPVTLAKLAAGEHDYLTPDLIPAYGVYFSFSGGPMLERLERRYGAPLARPLYCSADPALYAPDAGRPRWDLSYLGTYSADRQPSLERLLLEPARRAPDLSFVVAGPQYPGEIAWPANVERIEHLPPPAHREFYAASRATLNLTRADMAAAGWSPSIRLFEAAACGCAVISDAWEGLGAFFEPGREILTAAAGSDVLAALRRPEGFAAIGEAARARLLAAHTPAHRARAFEHGVAAAAR